MFRTTSPRLKGQPDNDVEQHPSDVIDKLFDLASEPDCFRKLDVLLKGEFQPLRPDFHRWASLLELDDVQEWLLRERSWCGTAFRRNSLDGIRFVQETLRRRLEHLETRTNPRKLIELWRWATEHAGVDDEIRSIWDRKQDLLEGTLDLSSPTPIPEQEEKFAALLRTAAGELAADTEARIKLKWAVETLRDLAQERCPQERPVRRAFARVVFAWKDREPDSCRRPGVLIPFEFRRKSMGWGSDKVDWFAPNRWFDEHFIEEMGSLIEQEGDCFPMSVLRDRLPEFPPRRLGGTSGKLAVAIAQRLANPSARGIASCAVPPWIVIAATARSGGDPMASSVDLLREKMLVLRQEGVRVAVVADTQLEIAELRNQFKDINIISFNGTSDDGATLLRNRRYTWDADLKALRPRLTRRHFIAAATAATATGITGLVFGKYIIPNNRVSPTRAMVLSMEREKAFKSLLSACKKIASSLDQGLSVNPINPDLTWLEDFCRRAYRRDDLSEPKIDVWAPGKRPPQADHASVGLETLARHSSFDCSQWERLDSERTIREVPTEASFSTTVYHFRRQKEGAIRIALEMNSGGFGVLPLLEPGDELILGTKPMDEAGRMTKGCDLLLIAPMEDVSGLPREAKNLIVVSTLSKVLHIRIFNSAGKIVVDTDENGLKDKDPQIKAFKDQLESLWPPHKVTEDENDRLIAAVTLIVSSTITKTSYVMRTIPADWPRDFEVTIHSIYFNGFQDQEVRHKDSDWCAIRVHPGTKDASLAFLKPARRMIRSIRKLERIEKGDIDRGVPATFSGAASEKFSAQDWYVWPIDTYELSKPTIYSDQRQLEFPSNDN